MQRLLLVALVSVIAQGCVGIGKYKELEGKHSHLLDVKEIWESEQSELSRRVEDTRLAYQRMTVDQGTFKSQMESVLQTMRAVKSDLQTLGTKVEGQGNILKEQQHQYGVVTDHFSQMISQVATLAETNHMLANRVERLTKITKQTATKVADAQKKPLSAATKRPPATLESSEAEDPGSKEKSVTNTIIEVLSLSPAPAGPEVSELEAVSGAGASREPRALVVPPASSGLRDPGNGTAQAGVGVMANPLEPTVPSTTADVGTSKSAPTTKPSRWEQLKILLGSSRLPQKKDSAAPAPIVLSRPAPVTGSSHTGEAMAAFPESRALSTISSFPGTPAPGAVINVPPAPKP